MTIQKAIIAHDSGQITITWFNQPFLKRVFEEGAFASISGYIRDEHQFQPVEYEILSDPTVLPLHTGKIVPVYPQTMGLTSRTIRAKMHIALLQYADAIKEFLPKELCSAYKLFNEKEAYERIHFPENIADVVDAKNRLSFDELFCIQLCSQLIKKEWNNDRVGHQFTTEKFRPQIDSFIGTFPFQLTNAQIRSINEILDDLGKPHPMNRMLQGDVGSGKTIVAAVASYVAQLNGYKTLIMAPTEILAQQHYKSLQKVLPKTILVTSQKKPTPDEKKQSSVIVGTHALVADKMLIDNVGLVIIDEQHKFGVSQRAKLKAKGINPHLLSMTATPIPRTVALTLYGELDISIIDEMPAGRKMVKTHNTPPHKRNDAYVWIAQQIKEHKTQAFIVCPLIEESSAETMKSVKAANIEYKRLSEDVFPHLKVGLLHGKLKPQEKELCMKQFADHVIDILVSTPVVEVGIDIPNATIIVIEAAERFGLAQLHQLRGRVGRSDMQSYCLLFTEKDEPAIQERLSLFSKTNDGFKLAMYDLGNRGSGTIYGTAQHGFSDLKIASLADIELIQTSRQATHTFVDGTFEVNEYPLLNARLEKLKLKHVSRD